MNKQYNDAKDKNVSINIFYYDDTYNKTTNAEHPYIYLDKEMTKPASDVELIDGIRKRAILSPAYSVDSPYLFVIAYHIMNGFPGSGVSVETMPLSSDISGFYTFYSAEAPSNFIRD